MNPLDPVRCFLKAQVLCALLLAWTASGEEREWRRIAKHGKQQTPVESEQKRGTCVKDTARACRSGNSGNVVDHVTQCLAGSSTFLADINPSHVEISKHQAYCSADMDPAATRGTCICGPDYCADTDNLCHRGTYQVINEVFTITSKAFPGEKLYMTADGKVKIGIPPDPRAAQWRVSQTGRGVKILWTELYTNTIMQEYESCATMTDSFGLTFTKCSRIVGNVADPRADEMGWYIELAGAHKQLGMGLGEVHVQFRSATTWDYFYISPVTKEGLACEARGRNCPGDVGAFSFDPPLVGRMDFYLDYAPGTLPPGLGAYSTTAAMALVLVCCLTCVYSADRKSKSCISGILMIPCEEIAVCLGFKGQGATI